MMLALLVLGVNAPTLDYGLAYDDVSYVLERPPAWEQGWQQFFGSRQWGVGRHAALLSLDLNRNAAGSTRPFHATNVAIAVLAVLLLFELARALGLGLGGALVAAALFAVHPLHTDAVVSIVGRATSMAGTSVLACLLLHTKRADRTAGGLILFALLAFLGLCSKESAIVIVPLLALHDLILTPGERAAGWRPYGAASIAVVAWATLNYANFATVAPIAYIDNPLAHVDALRRVLRGAELLWQYAWLAVWPAHLLPDRSYAVTDATLRAGPIGAVAWLGVAAAAWMLRKRAPRLVFCTLWFPAAFAATANIAFPIGTIMAERLTYLPSAGPCLLAGLATTAISQRNKLAGYLLVPVAAVAVFALALLYDDRGRIWTSDHHYHEMTAVLCPRSAKAHYNLGLARIRSGDTRGGAAAFSRSLEIYPAYSLAAYYLASIDKEAGRLEAAAAVWRAYLDRVPDDSGAHSQLIYVLLELGELDEALEHARVMYEQDPDNRDYLVQLLTIEEHARRANGELNP